MSTPTNVGATGLVARSNNGWSNNVCSTTPYNICRTPGVHPNENVGATGLLARSNNGWSNDGWYNNG